MKRTAPGWVEFVMWGIIGLCAAVLMWALFAGPAQAATNPNHDCATTTATGRINGLSLPVAWIAGEWWLCGTDSRGEPAAITPAVQWAAKYPTGHDTPQPGTDDDQPERRRRQPSTGCRT